MRFDIKPFFIPKLYRRSPVYALPEKAWTIAAWCDEIPASKPFARKLLGENVVFYRRSDGQLAALQDRCPHRFAPLSMGSIVDDKLQCLYHGLQFGADGLCKYNPHGDGVIPRAARVKNYPLLERHLAVWIWMGDPELADPAQLLDFSFIETTPVNKRILGKLHNHANFQLGIDNIMDLSHSDFMHANTLGGGAVTRSIPKLTKLADHRVQIRWEITNDVPPPMFHRFMPEGDKKADCYTTVEWIAPALMRLGQGTEIPDFDNPRVEALHMMTPETETSTHYFYALTRSFGPDTAEFNNKSAEMLRHVFSAEDTPMIEAQQRNLGEVDLMSQRPLMLRHDAGNVEVRRMLAALIKQELDQRPQAA